MGYFDDATRHREFVTSSIFVTVCTKQKSGISISERIKAIEQLERGKLQIINLDHTMHKQSLEANVKSKKHLDQLILSFRKEFLKSIDKQNALTKVLKCLRPHNNIQQKIVEYYEGERLPSWFKDYSFSMLTDLKLQNCIECKQLPAIGQLPHLKYFKLENFSSFENVGIELLGNKTIAFPSLQVLFIYNMPILKKWCYEEERKMIFPRLQEVHVSLCKSLSLFQLPKFSPLDKFNVSWCDSLHTIHGLEGSCLVIEQWKGILDLSKGQDDESLLMLQHECNIVDSCMLKLQINSKGKSLPTHMLFTILGCPLLQKACLTCTANKLTPTTEETLSLAVGDKCCNFFRTIAEILRKRPDHVSSEAELEPQLLLMSSRSLFRSQEKISTLFKWKEMCINTIHEGSKPNLV